MGRRIGGPCDVYYDAGARLRRCRPLRSGSRPVTLLTNNSSLPGERIRLRFINTGASTYFRLRLDRNPLTITHADGIAVRPVTVDHLLSDGRMLRRRDLTTRVGELHSVGSRKSTKARLAAGAGQI
jgi:Multicopper oxidase